MNELIKIITRFRSHQLSALEYIQFSQKILMHLKTFHPIFSDIHSWGDKPTAWTKIADDFSNFQEVVFEHIRDDEINYINKDRDDKGFYLDSYTWTDFSNSYSNTKKEQDGRYSVTIGAGSEDGLGYVNIELPRINYPDFYNLQLVKQIIAHITEVVDLTSAYVYTQGIYSKVVDYDKEYDIEIGWINYFKNKEVLKYLPSGVSHDETEKGAFFWLSDKITEPSKEIIEAAITVRDILGEKGFLEFHAQAHIV